MDKFELLDKLKEIGIESNNAFPKATFANGGEIVVALYGREMKEDFYFFNKYDSKVYVWVKGERVPSDYRLDGNTEKRLIPMTDCEMVWEDKVFEEKPDLRFDNMTLRHYAAIHLSIPDSGLPWLDTMIKEANRGVPIT